MSQRRNQCRDIVRFVTLLNGEDNPVVSAQLAETRERVVAYLKSAEVDRKHRIVGVYLLQGLTPAEIARRDDVPYSYKAVRKAAYEIGPRLAEILDE